MNIKYEDGQGFSKIATGVSDLFVCVEYECDGSISRYGIHYCSKGESIAHSICFFTKREEAENFMLKVCESVNKKNRKPFWAKGDYKNTEKVIDLDKIRNEVHNEY